jgi:O-antigen ligase
MPVLAVMLVLLALRAVAGQGSEDMASADVVIDATSAMSTGTRAVIYAVALLTLCLLQLKIPDAPTLALVFSMPIAEFLGLRVAIMILQCGIVCLRTRTLRHLVPSWPLFAFLVCIAASASWALDPMESLFAESVGITALLPQAPIAIAASALLSAGLTSVRRLLWALTLGCIPGCAFMGYNAFAGITWQAASKAYYMGFLRPDIFSPMLVMSAIFLLFCVTSRTVRLLGKILAGILLSVVCVALLLTGIRSGWTAFLVSALAMLALSRSWGALAGLAAVGIALAVLWFTFAPSLGLEEQLTKRTSEQSLDTGEMRVEYWLAAAQGFLERPVLGIGWGVFPYFVADYIGRRALTHNIFVRIGCELGVVGFALFLTWVVTTVLRVRHSPDRRLIVILVLGVLVQGLFLDLFTGNYFWLFLGLGDGACRRHGHRGLARASSSYGWPRSRISPVAT